MHIQNACIIQLSWDLTSAGPLTDSTGRRWETGWKKLRGGKTVSCLKSEESMGRSYTWCQQCGLTKNLLVTDWLTSFCKTMQQASYHGELAVGQEMPPWNWSPASVLTSTSSHLLPALDSWLLIKTFSFPAYHYFIPCEKLCTCFLCPWGSIMQKIPQSEPQTMDIAWSLTLTCGIAKSIQGAFGLCLNHSWPSIWSNSLRYFDGFIELLV